MRVYASTAEAKELLSEMELLWDQIKDLSSGNSSPTDPLGFTPIETDARTRLKAKASTGSLRYFEEAESRRWKRDVSVTLEIINEKIIDLDRRIAHQEENQVKQSPSASSSNWKSMFVSKLMNLIYNTIKHISIDIILMLVILNSIRWIRRSKSLTASSLNVYFTDFLRRISRQLRIDVKVIG